MEHWYRKSQVYTILAQWLTLAQICHSHTLAHTVSHDTQRDVTADTPHSHILYDTVKSKVRRYTDLTPVPLSAQSHDHIGWSHTVKNAAVSISAFSKGADSRHLLDLDWSAPHHDAHPIPR